MRVLKVSQQTDKLKNQSESNKQAQDNLHEQVQEQKTLLRSAQDRAHTLETSVTELTAQLTDSKEKVSQLDAQVGLCVIYIGVIDIVLQFVFIDVKFFYTEKTVSSSCFSSAEGKDRDVVICRGS